MSCVAGLCTSGPTCVAMVSAGETHSCAMLGGWLKCWGKNDFGQLGQGDREARGDDPGEMGDKLPPVSLGVGRQVAEGFKVAVGSAHTCVVLDNGDVKCWGDNRMGQLGVGSSVTAVDRGDALPPVDLGRGRTVTSLVAGAYHTCASLVGGDVKCWGDNRFGQLGLGAPGNRGLVPGDMGDNLPAVDLGPGARATWLAAGAYHTCAVLLEDGAVKCWGQNDYGQLGVGDSRSRGLAGDDLGTALAAVPIGKERRAVQLAAGTYHTCATLENYRDILCWGYNGAGQLGRGSLGPDNPIRQQSMGRKPFTAENLRPVAFAPGHSALAITAGAGHVCVLLDDHSLRCWGLNIFGQLGLGTNDNRGDDVNEMGDHLPAVKVGREGTLVTSVSAGGDHTCAVQGPSVHCWGLSSYGRLGHPAAPGQRTGPPTPVDLGSGAPQP